MFFQVNSGENDGTSTERNAASERNGGTDCDELWDGEDDFQEPSISRRPSRAKRRRAEGAEEAAAPVRAGRRHNQRTVIDDEDEESARAAGASLTEAVPVARPQEKVSGDTLCALCHKLVGVFRYLQCCLSNWVRSG